jgi:hypothetical protein
MQYWRAGTGTVWERHSDIAAISTGAAERRFLELGSLGLGGQ